MEFVVTTLHLKTAFAVLASHSVLDYRSDFDGIAHTKQVRTAVLGFKALAFAKSTAFRDSVEVVNLIQ